MPTYQYACTACDERLEAVQSFSDAPLTDCPACGGTLRKVFSAVGVVFKGSGFYKNDSRDSGKKAAKKDPATTSGEGSSSSSDSKASSSEAKTSSSNGSSTSSESSSTSTSTTPAKTATPSKPAGKSS